ncbi:MAG TPA: hypothetical protein VFH99_00115 [Candidatus Saccharimonadales bacterium]|nr:hypothetical protein [Candidatus Saccharimonadales bacterium]
MDIEAARAERPWEGKGHDRLVLMEDIGRFALFDGASQAMASDIAAATFREQHAGVDEFSLPFLNDVFALIQQNILRFGDNLPERYQHLKGQISTTGTAVGIRTLPNNHNSSVLEYVHAGDSSLWMFDHDSDILRKLTRDEIIGNSPDNCLPNTRNWLGALGHRLEQRLGFPLKTGRATLALFSDGVSSYETQEGSLTKEKLEEILRSTDNTPGSKATQIIQNSSIKDDASVIVVEVEQ